MQNNFYKQPSQNLETVTHLVASEMGVALYFSAPNCGICVALKPKITQLISQKFPEIKFKEIASDQSPEIAAHFGVFSAPTLLVFFEGKEFSRNVRNLSLLELEEKLQRPYGMLVK
ncbi:thioredoxin [Aequorivita sp. H23M31]|uniref:Thioredoxin n=1 Tax=Aequorivita ciconiae TaxID=2494375 RepID=A0A410G652_9FLAO|nr:thioredoxin family protein [Aequorivita sp. H23M31]QAA82749.1 thioredoxin [Aequorivita sp. H23M31]